MTENPGGYVFSEAAQLFAENLEIVDAMANRFTEEVNEYLDRVYERMTVGLGPDRFTEQAKKGTSQSYRSWWLHHAQHWKVPHLWVEARDPRLVLSELVASGWVQQADPRKLSVLRQQVQALDLPTYAAVDTTASSKGKIFEVAMRYEDMDDNVDDAAAVLSELLQAMIQAWQELEADEEVEERAQT